MATNELDNFNQILNNDISIYVYDSADVPVSNAFVSIYDGVALVDSDYTDISGLFETDLERLERTFIIEPKEMLWNLECKMLNLLDQYNISKKQFDDYKEFCEMENQ